jgi:hypothetical protein
MIDGAPFYPVVRLERGSPGLYPAPILGLLYRGRSMGVLPMHGEPADSYGRRLDAWEAQGPRPIGWVPTLADGTIGDGRHYGTRP